jgi:RecA-family ATPase
MHEGQMHGTLRDVGRLAGGYAAAGSLPASDLAELEDLAISLSINSEDGASKWREAVEFGRKDPVKWDKARMVVDRVLDWEDEIRDDTYQVIDDWVEPVEVQEPEQWNPVQQISTYLDILFEPDDYVGYVSDSWSKDGRRVPSRGSYGRTCRQLLEELEKYKEVGAVFGDVDPEVGAWIRFNPLDGQGIKDVNVTDYRYALVECDDETLSIDQQRAIYQKLELPIAVMVHSGNKSLHAIVRIEASDLAQYKGRVDLLYEVCGKNRLKIDRQNKNPSRLSRMPGVMRNGRKQYIVATNTGKSSWAEWEEWISAVNDDLPEIESLSSVWDDMPDLAAPLIDGVLRQGHKMLLSGSSKGGKSFLLMELCIAIAEGVPWLGWPVTKGRVMYVNLELDRASCLQRFKAVYKAMGLPPKNLKSIDIWNLRGHAVPMDKLAPKLIRRAAKRQYSAVIIDPIYKVITGDENAADKMAFFCNQFDLVCHQLKASVIYCHHHSKGAQGGKRSMDRASGSGVFARDPDALLDMIELIVPDELRKAECARVEQEHVERNLNRLFPDWRTVSTDPYSASKSLLSEEDHLAILRECDAIRADSERWTAWRVEGTFREFGKSRPKNCWFRHPLHYVEAGGPLVDADTHGEEPPWKRGLRSQERDRPKKSHKKQQQLLDAFGACVADDGGAPICDVANALQVSDRTVRDWLKGNREWRVEKGRIFREEEGAF